MKRVRVCFCPRCSFLSHLFFFFDPFLISSFFSTHRADISNIGHVVQCVNVDSLSLRGNCITSLSGIHALAGKLRSLDVSLNRLCDLGDIGLLTELRELHLENNKIESFDTFRSLQPLTRLEKLYAASNPAVSRTEKSRYRARIRSILPNLRVLDGESVHLFDDDNDDDDGGGGDKATLEPEKSDGAIDRSKVKVTNTKGTIFQELDLDLDSSNGDDEAFTKTEALIRRELKLCKKATRRADEAIQETGGCDDAALG